MHPAIASGGTASVPIWFVTADTYAQVREQLGAAARRFAETAKFEPKAGQFLLLPDPDGALSGVLFGLESANRPDKDRFLPGRLPGLLPAGTYRFANAPHDARLAALAFALGSYRFTRYRKADANGAKLVMPDGVDGDDVSRIAEGVALARDLINTPANDMGPAELEQAARDLGARHGVGIRSIVGEDLLQQNFPLIHAVGRASPRAPRLIDLTWGDARHPKITLVGKGVCFDTGGLDIKPDNAMLIMKKDMGGAASVLALATISARPSACAAPPMSFFISFMPASLLRSSPPVSKHTPLPTTVILGASASPQVRSISRGGRVLARPTAWISG